MAIRGGRPINRQIVPHIIVQDVDAAIAFYKRAFGAVELFRTLRPDGSGERYHCHLGIGESVLVVTRENPGRAGPFIRSPQTVGGLNGLLELFVDDTDAFVAQAEREGAEIFRKPEHAFFGDRYAQLLDPNGYVWAISTPQELLTGDECRERMDEFYRGLGLAVVSTPAEKIPDY